MKFKKLALTITIGALLIGSAAACGKASPAASEAATEAATENEYNADDYFVSFNGANLNLGMEFAKVKDMLGSETKPAETIEPCDGGDYIQEMHFYDGLTVNTLRGETIIGLEVPQDGGDGAMMQGKVKKGATVDEVKKQLGNPENEDEYSLSYTIGTASLMIYLSDGVVSGSMAMSFQ